MRWLKCTIRPRINPPLRFRVASNTSGARATLAPQVSRKTGPRLQRLPSYVPFSTIATSFPVQRAETRLLTAFGAYSSRGPADAFLFGACLDATPWRVIGPAPRAICSACSEARSQISPEAGRRIAGFVETRLENEKR